MGKVILTPQAQDDLREIVSFIAKQNPERARSFGSELIDHALTLAEQPERGRMAPELSEPSVRKDDTPLFSLTPMQIVSSRESYSRACSAAILGSSQLYSESKVMSLGKTMLFSRNRAPAKHCHNASQLRRGCLAMVES